MRRSKCTKYAIIIGIIFFIIILLGANTANATISHRFKGYAMDTTGKVVKDSTVITAIVVSRVNASETATQNLSVDNTLSNKNYDFDTLDAPDSDYEDGAIFFFIGGENSTNDSTFRHLNVNDPNLATYFNLTIVDAPQITDNSPSNGSTGDPFTFNVSVIDYVDPGSNLTVTVNWTHGNSLRNDSLNFTGGTYYAGTFNLAHDMSSIVYTFWANDTSTNYNSSIEASVPVYDNDVPEFTDYPSSNPTTGDAYNFTINVTDNIVVHTVWLNYYFTGSWINASMSYDASSDKYYKSLSAPSDATILYYNVSANDNSSNWNETGADTLTVIDNDAPEITDNTAGTAYTGDSYTFNATVTDNIDTPTVYIEYWYNGETHTNASMTPTGFGNNFEKTITVNHTTEILYYLFSTNDTVPNWNTTSTLNVGNVVDNDEPTTTIEIDEQVHPDATTNHSNITSSTNIYLNSTDNIGQTYIHYRIWNTTNSWSSWVDSSADENKTITLDEEGKNYLEYYANDTANNIEITYNVTIWVDITAPTTTLAINEQVSPDGGTDGAYVTSSTTMTLSATDSPSHNSGVQYSEYRYWNSSNGWTSWTTYSAAFALGADEGTYYLEYRSIDNVSNTETANNDTIYVDNTAPSVSSIEYGGLQTYYKDADTVTIYANLTEAGSGILETSVKISIDTTGTDISAATMTKVTNTEWTYSWNVPSGSDGNVNVSVEASDNLSQSVTGTNWSVSKYIDNTAPVVDSIEYSNGDTYYSTTDEVTIFVNMTEAGSGIDETSPTISIDTNGTDVSGASLNKTTNTAWSYVWNVPGGSDGYATVTIAGNDNVSLALGGTTSDESKIIDNTAPVVDSIEYSNGDTYYSTTDEVTIFVNMTEAGSGIDETSPTISIDTNGTDVSGASLNKTTNTAWSYVWNVPGGSDGYATVTIAGNDNVSLALGGTTSDESKIIDNTAPSSTIYNQTAGYYSYFHNSALTLTAEANFSSETAGSGLKNVTLWYWFNNATNNETKINTSWSGPTFSSTDSTPLVNQSGNTSNVSWSYSFPDGVGYYRFCSMAYDNISNNETRLEVSQTNGTELFYNNTLPNASSNPTPANGASGVSRTTDLSWTGSDPDGDNITFDVYFGTDSTPDSTELGSSDQNTTTYDTGTMSYGTTYYWKILTRDEHGATTDGTIWSFTTVEESGGGGSGGPVIPVNSAPTADANGPYSGTTGSPIELDGSGSSDPNSGDTLYYKWDFENDGEFDTTWLTSSTVVHSYSSAGVFTVKLMVKDNNEAYDNDTAEVTITLDTSGLSRPTAHAGGPYNDTTYLTYQNITFNGSKSSDTDGTIVNYTWNMGDGTTLYDVITIYNYTEAGLYIITLTVTDNDGLIGVNTTTINISLDTDADGWSDEIEESYETDKNDPDDTPPDSDNDGIPDTDSPDGKYKGDPDDDNDGIPDEEDLGPDGEDYSKDHDNDGIPDSEDDDTDNDGIPDEIDEYPYDYDNDGKRDDLDDDDDNDGLTDEEEKTLGTSSTNSTDVADVEINGKTYYLIDDDADGEFDKLYDPQTQEIITRIQKQDDGTYLVDLNNDGKWDYVVDPSLGSSVIYKEKEPEGLGWWVYVLGAIFIIFLILFFLFKTGYLYIEEQHKDEKHEPKKKEPAKKTQTKSTKKKK